MSKQSGDGVLGGQHALWGDRVVLAPRFGQELKRRPRFVWVYHAINSVHSAPMGKKQTKFIADKKYNYTIAITQYTYQKFSSPK